VKGSLARLAGSFRGLLRLDDPPPRLAAALAVGVFIGCTPFWGFQTLLCVVIASVFGLNRAVTLAGTWLNLPWFAPFVYGAAIRIGWLVAPGLREADAASFDLLLRDPGALSWETVWSWVRGSSLPLVIGSSIVGAAAAAVTYPVALAILVRRRRRTRPPEMTDTPRRHVA
jgi:uncharacterized protein (DUF2062 family)